MEKALFITSETKLHYFRSEYHRIYFGNEFCESLIPSIEQVSNVINFAQKNNRTFSLITPYVTDEGIARIKKICEFLSDNRLHIEIIINDWGVLRVVSTEFNGLTPVIGRLLVKMKREPRLKAIKDKISPLAWKQFQTAEVTASSFITIMKKYRIARIELDNVYQGIQFPKKNTGICASLYYPYIYLNTTRYCYVSTCEKPGNLIGIFPCTHECQKYTFKLKNKGMLEDIILKGNTQFLRNEKLPENLKEMGIDRIVFQPEIPM